MRLHEAGRLGFCQQPVQGTEAILGTGNSAQVCSAGCPTGWNPKAHRMAYTYSTLLRSVGTEFKVMQELLRHSSLRSTLDIYTQAISPAKDAAQAAVLALVFSSETNVRSLGETP